MGGQEDRRRQQLDQHGIPSTHRQKVEKAEGFDLAKVTRNEREGESPGQIQRVKNP